MPVLHVAQAHYPKDAQLNTVLGDYKRKINEIIDTLAKPSAGGSVKVHASTHELGGSDLLDHDKLTNFVGNEHLLVGAINHDSLLNYIAGQHLLLPNTIANVLSNHTKAIHDALNIDADTLDALSSADFLRSNAAQNITGNLEWQDNIAARFGNGADFRIYHSGTHHYLRGYKHGANIILQAEDDGGATHTLLTLNPDIPGALVKDHGSAATDMLVNVCYGTGSPPTATTTTIGALFIKYTA